MVYANEAKTTILVERSKDSTYYHHCKHFDHKTNNSHRFLP